MSSEVTLNIKAGSQSIQMICRKVGTEGVIFESANGHHMIVGPAADYPGIAPEDTLVMFVSFCKPELKSMDKVSSLIKPGLVL